MRYTFDSREVRPGMGFVALKGEKVDGHDFIPQALAAGAADVIDGLDELQRRARERRKRHSLEEPSPVEVHLPLSFQSIGTVTFVGM